jgi:hypothetical protein
MDPDVTAKSTDRAILTYWRLPRPNGQTLDCTSYRTPAGLELRAGMKGKPALRQADVASHVEAQRLAELWRGQFARSAAA